MSKKSSYCPNACNEKCLISRLYGHGCIAVVYMYLSKEPSTSCFYELKMPLYCIFYFSEAFTVCTAEDDDGFRDWLGPRIRNEK